MPSAIVPPVIAGAGPGSVVTGTAVPTFASVLQVPAPPLPPLPVAPPLPAPPPLPALPGLPAFPLEPHPAPSPSAPIKSPIERRFIMVLFSLGRVPVHTARQSIWGDSSDRRRRKCPLSAARS